METTLMFTGERIYSYSGVPHTMKKNELLIQAATRMDGEQAG